MTAATMGAPATTAGDETVAELWSAIDGSFLRLLSWDDERRVLTFPKGHSQLGWVACRVQECGKDAKLSAHGLCVSCVARWRQTPDMSLDDFVMEPKPLRRSIGVGTCRVERCPRPWKSSKLWLCVAHDYQRQKMFQVSLAEFLARKDVTPFPSFGPCTVAACTRDRVGKGPYCHTHQERFYHERKRNPDLDVQHWNLTTPAISENGDVSLRGLHPRVVAEVIYALQERTAGGSKTRYWLVRPMIDQVRARQSHSLLEIPPEDLGHNAGLVLTTFTRQIRKFEADPEVEWQKDVWDLMAFGHSGTLDFTKISQPWLREATRIWAREDLPRRRGNQIGGIVQGRINAIALLSESLRLHRKDKGNILALLSRQDITNFCNRLAYLVDRGVVSANQRLVKSRQTKHVLGEMRVKLSLTRSGQPLHGLPEDFNLTASDIPDEPDDIQAGRDLPLEVMRHLCDHLPTLEATSQLVRVAVELIIDTGRRPKEICSLALDCLRRDSNNAPVLVYDNHKANRPGRELPIVEATAALIVAQQELVRSRFPETPMAELKLLPSPTRNPGGARTVTEGWVGKRHRDWVTSLPDVFVPLVVHEDGNAVTKMLPFDKAKIFPYAYRHTYAQRHADAGVDVTVLKELMDHRQLSTTQGYYNVGQERRREAVERVTTMQFDRRGNRVWRKAKEMLDSEHTRRAVGEVAVPYGGCSEPSNVAAGGEDCPLRFRCIGCGHFNTDVSYLPDLERYLADLLRHRERLRAALDADEWAKNEALPSDDEIKRIRRLIDRMKGDLDDLTAEERAQVEDAVSVVRQGRRKITALGMPRIGQPLPDVRPERSA